MQDPRLRLELHPGLVPDDVRAQGLARSWFRPCAAACVSDLVDQVISRYRLGHPREQLQLLLDGFTVPMDAPMDLLRDGDAVAVQLLQAPHLQGPSRQALSAGPAPSLQGPALPAPTVVPAVQSADPGDDTQKCDRKRAYEHVGQQGAPRERAPKKAANGTAGAAQASPHAPSAKPTGNGDPCTRSTPSAAGANVAAAAAASGAPTKLASRSARRKASKRRLRRQGVLPYPTKPAGQQRKAGGASAQAAPAVRKQATTGTRAGVLAAAANASPLDPNGTLRGVAGAVPTPAGTSGTKRAAPKAQTQAQLGQRQQQRQPAANLAGLRGTGGKAQDPCSSDGTSSDDDSSSEASSSSCDESSSDEEGGTATEKEAGARVRSLPQRSPAFGAARANGAARGQADGSSSSSSDDDSSSSDETSSSSPDDEDTTSATSGDSRDARRAAAAAAAVRPSRQQQQQPPVLCQGQATAHGRSLLAAGRGPKAAGPRAAGPGPSLPDPSGLPSVLAGPLHSGDVVAYTLLEIGLDMCPKVSEWRYAQVSAYDAAGRCATLVPHPDPSAHPLQRQMDEYRASMAAEGGEATQGDDAGGSCEPLPFETLYSADGSLVAELDAFCDMRLVRGSSARAQLPASSPPAVPPSAAAAPVNGVESRRTPAHQLAPAGQPSAPSGSAPGAAVPAVGPWAEVADQLSRRRQELLQGAAAPQPSPLGPPQPPLVTIPVSLQPLRTAPLRQAAAEGMGAGRWGPPPVDAQQHLGSGDAARAEGGGDLGVAAPAAVRPRKGVRSTALGPMLNYLRTTGAVG